MPAETNITNAITNAASYTGSKELGGGYDAGITLDTRPLELLAGYTYAYNREMWQKKQKDAENAAKGIAEITSYDITSPITKDRDVMLDQWKGLMKMVENDPTVMDYSKNPQGYIKYQEEKNKMQNTVLSAKTRTITYNARQQAIQNETNPALKSQMQKQLTEAVDTTTINEPLRYQNYDTSIPTIGAPPSLKVTTGKIGDNTNALNTVELPDPGAARRMAYMTVNGLSKEMLDESSPEFQSLSPEEQAIRREDFAFKKASGKYFANDQAKYLNEALDSFRDADGKIDYNKINSSNAAISGMLRSILKVNDYLKNTSDQIQAGVYSNDLGTIKFGQSNLNQADWTPINIEDGIQPEEIYFVQSMLQAQGKSNALQLQQTDNALQKEGNAIKWAELGLDKAKFAAQQKQWEASQKGSETQVNGAMETAKRIFGDLQKIAVKDIQGRDTWLITPDKVRQLNTEQLKYLGIEAPQQRDADGKIIENGGFKPLDLSPKTDEKGNVINGTDSYAIELDNNGNIKILAGAKQAGNGKWGGKYDNTKSTNIYNIATNRLNEELKTAGTKELNSYWGVDVSHNNTSFTDSRESSQKSNSTKTSELSMNPADWKQEGKNWRYKDGSLYNSKGEKIN